MRGKLWLAPRMRPPKFPSLLACLVLAACAQRVARREHPRPPIVVGVIVDQLAAWIAAERLPLLPADGGFARLRREGTYIRDLRFAHAITETGPGHAALYTACAPWKSGIIANDRMEPDGRTVPFLLDADTHELTPHGKLDRPSLSLARLNCETVADRLRAAMPQAFIASLSFKNRSAILPGGRHADASLWFDTSLDSFATSSAVADVFPSWAAQFADPQGISRWRPAEWPLLDPAFVQAHASSVDAAPGEADFLGLGTTFPHPIRGANAAAAFRDTPFADAFLLQLGTLAIDAADGRDGPTLLELSLSSNDIIGHTFGPESWEAWDEILRLDRSLGEFMARLDAAVGPEGWSMVLSADHGVAVLPETAKGAAWCGQGKANRWELPCEPGTRITVRPLLNHLQIATELALGKGPWIAAIESPYLILTDRARGLTGARRDKLDRAIRSVLEAAPGLAQAFEVRSFPSPCPPEQDDSIPALVCRSIVPGLGGDYYLVTRPGSFFAFQDATDAGTEHGSPYLFDRSVPLLARVPGKVARGRVIDGPLPYETFARVLATALRVDFSAADGGADLTGP